MEIYAVKLLSKIEDFKYNQFLSKVEEKKRLKINKYLKMEDRQRSLIAEVLIRNIIYKKFCIRNDEIILYKNKYGKPFFKNIHNFYFNNSHSDEWIVSAIADVPVGIDVERIKPIDVDEISEAFFSKEENEAIKAKNKLDRLSFFYDIWTLKESYIKAVGRGLSIPLNSFTVKFVNKNIMAESEEERLPYFFKQFNIDDKYKISICAKSKIVCNKVNILGIDDII